MEAVLILFLFFPQYIGSLDVPRPNSRVEIVTAMRRIRVSVAKHITFASVSTLLKSLAGVLGGSKPVWCPVTSQLEAKHLIFSFKLGPFKIFSDFRHCASVVLLFVLFKGFKVSWILNSLSLSGHSS